MRWVLTGLAMMLALAACSPAKAELTPAQFQDRVVAAIGRSHPKAKVDRIDENTLQVHYDGASEPEVINLRRAYALYQGTPTELGAIVGQLARPREPFDISSADDLVVLVRPATFGADAELARPLAGGLVAVVAVDSPQRYAFVPGETLRTKLQLSNQAIWDRALENTRRLIGFKPIEISLGRPAAISTQAGLAASLLAFDDYWNSAERTDGPLAVAVFGRDDLFVATVSDAKAIEVMREGMAEIRDDPNGLTNDLLVRRNGRWEVLE